MRWEGNVFYWDVSDREEWVRIGEVGSRIVGATRLDNDIRICTSDGDFVLYDADDITRCRLERFAG